MIPLLPAPSPLTQVGRSHNKRSSQGHFQVSTSGGSVPAVPSFPRGGGAQESFLPCSSWAVQESKAKPGTAAAGGRFLLPKHLLGWWKTPSGTRQGRRICPMPWQPLSQDDPHPMYSLDLGLSPLPGQPGTVAVVGGGRKLMGGRGMCH